MNIRFLAIAQGELDDAYSWYEHQSTGLGLELLDEIDRAVHRISQYPLSCSELAFTIRRVLINRFPYGLVYGIDGDTIVVIAVAHLHRQPHYWIERLDT